METFKILVADPISDQGVEELKSEPRFEVDVKTGQSEDDLLPIIGEYSALIVRSQTKATERLLENASKMKVIGRAGVGVDNIDIPTATRHGIVVMNTPSGNTISTAEHAFSLLCALARNIPQAHASMIAGNWDRKKFKGIELHGKTLAILGMGRIGSELARRAMAFGMRVIACDPYLSVSRARLLRVELYEDIDEALQQADIVTLHMPKTPETHHLISDARLSVMKKGVWIINCARGGLIDEEALARHLVSGHVAGAAVDVYESEPPPPDNPLLGLPNVVLTPHLGASTAEAQENVGIEIARQVQRFLLDGEVVNALNTPSIDAKTVEEVGSYLTFAETLGRVLSQLAPTHNEFLRIDYSGKVSDLDTRLISRSALKGFLEIACGKETLNYINAPSFAEQRGLKFSESRLPEPIEYTDLIEVSCGTDKESASVSGTFFGNEPRIVSINEHPVEAAPEGAILVLENKDIPGIVGRVGTLLGESGINIASMSLSRNRAGGHALTVINLDSAPSDEVMQDLLGKDEIVQAKRIRL